MNAPTCRLCKARHWTTEPHAGLGPVHNNAKSWTETVTLGVTPVTLSAGVTVGVTVTPERESGEGYGGKVWQPKPVTKDVTIIPPDVTIKPEDVTIIPDVTLIPEDVTIKQKGRPKTGSALTPAQRKALSRQRKVKDG